MQYELTLVAQRIECTVYDVVELGSDVISEQWSVRCLLLLARSHSSDSCGTEYTCPSWRGVCVRVRVCALRGMRACE